MNSEHGSGKKDPSSAVLDPTMSLVGRLEDLSLGEILQIVSLSKRSGLLRLESPDGKASLYIRAGKVIYAVTSEEKGGVFGLLSESGVIDPAELEPLMEKLESTSSPQEFRDLLGDRTGMSRDRFQDLLKARVERLAYSLFLWEEGTFSFQLIEDETTHPLLSKVAPFFLDEGIGAQFLVMEGARRKDEMLRDSMPAGGRDKSPMVDPQKVLGEDWEHEFEQQLTGTKIGYREEVAERSLKEEIEEFVVPEALPRLPGQLAGKVVAVGLQAPLVVEITGGLVRAGIELLVHENGADALTRVQELRQQGQEPYMLIDIEAAGITDDRVLGGLETVSTMWDFGFHLPVGLVCRREVEEELGSRLRTVTGLTVFPMSEPGDKGSVQKILETITGIVGPSFPYHAEGEDPPSAELLDGDHLGTASLPEPVEDKTPPVQESGSATGQGEDYYDIEQEFSEELGDIDLPLEGWDETQVPHQEVSTDPHMARLSSYVNELNRQDISGEITLLALRFASTFVNRAILFLLRKDDIKGLGQFGVELGQDLDPDSVVRSLNLPLGDQSVFQRVSRHRQSYKGPPTGSDLEKSLFEALGGGIPSEIFIGPIVSMGKVAVLLYGDDFPLGRGLEPTHTLDIFLSHVGLALDRAFLEMKLKSQRS